MKRKKSLGKEKRKQKEKERETKEKNGEEGKKMKYNWQPHGCMKQPHVGSLLTVTQGDRVWGCCLWLHEAVDRSCLRRVCDHELPLAMANTVGRNLAASHDREHRREIKEEKSYFSSDLGVQKI